MKARCSGPGFSAVPRPSTVVIVAARRATEIGMRQEKTALAVDQHRAGAALAEAAAELGAVERQVVAQHVEQRRVGVGVDLVRCAVDVEGDHAGRPSCLISRTRSAAPSHGGSAREVRAEIGDQRRDLLVGQRPGEARHHRAGLALGRTDAVQDDADQVARVRARHDAAERQRQPAGRTAARRPRAWQVAQAPAKTAAPGSSPSLAAVPGQASARCSAEATVTSALRS